MNCSWWKISYILYFLAIISAIIGIVVGFGVGSKNGGDLNDNDAHNVTRANFFFLASIAIGILALFQWGIEQRGLHHHKYRMKM